MNSDMPVEIELMLLELGVDILELARDLELFVAKAESFEQKILQN